MSIVALLFSAFLSHSSEGLVEIKSTYTDLKMDSISAPLIVSGETIQTGQGFISSFPVKSPTNGKIYNLKVILTAAHLSLGGVYASRELNLEVRSKINGRIITYLGMLSDALHDLSIIFLCTSENIDYLQNEIFKEDSPFLEFKDDFISGGACLPNKTITSDIKPFSHFDGSPFELITNDNDEKWTLDVSDWIRHQGKHKLNNLEQELTKVDAYTATVDYEAKNTVTPFTLKDSVVENDLSFSEYLSESYFKIPLDHGFSGSPIIQSFSNELSVTGVYKSSTLSSTTNSYGYGWYTPINQSHGLLKQFLINYPIDLHSWSVIPQAYILSINGVLVRQQILSHYYIIEVPQTETPTFSFEREDRGSTEWIRADTGDENSYVYDYYKSLQIVSADSPNGAILNGFSMITENGELRLLPPSIESTMILARHNCLSCGLTNQSSLELGRSAPLYQTGDLVKAIKDVKTNESYNYFNTKLDSNISKARVTFINKGDDAISVLIDFEADQITFDIDENGLFIYEHPTEGLKSSSYQPALNIKTKNGENALLEISGIIYYNSEIPESHSHTGLAFRLLINSKFYLFLGDRNV